MWYGYTQSSVPAVIPAGGGLAPMGGPFYDFDADLGRPTPSSRESFDGKAVLLRVGQEPRLDSMQLDGDTGKLEKVNRFLPNTVVPVAAVD